ncbi:ABC transporter ATP-binding protein [Nocardioides piscis]|uniref:ABC-type quaternary amine transporter n=1 Tax=Nocardioides piscis TaxID=2714938 RepID=A0A6G7YFK6_9ACTN|nr:ABC transporter ATP-binding protein [Nocardioides piscis]QIK75560.1 ABC transporter ATP-binding protein [Nocardioides piscis]
MSRVTLRGVSRSFGSVHAVDGVDLDVQQGSLTAVLGPSGCGKTTLLRLVAGFLTPQAGTIAFDDRVVAGEGRSIAPQERRVGYVPQEGALFPHLDVAANIAFGLPRAERSGGRVAEMLDLVELPASFARRSAHELSGGQQQRVALARALAPRPSVVLLDEPFSSLDASLRISTGRAVARALRAAGATALLVTHDQDEALSLSDQVAVMRAGRLVQAADPRDLYRFPVDDEVARFVGGAAILAATVTGGVATCALGSAPVHADVADGAVRVVVRPEQLALVHEGAPARVVDVSFYGHDAAVQLELPDGQRVVARGPGLDAPQAGSEVRIAIQGAVHCLPSGL